MAASAPRVPLLIFGTVALDTILTATDRRDRILGGSGSHAGLAAALYGPVRLVSAVGEDFPEAALASLRRTGVDLAGVVHRVGRRSMSWTGRYSADLASRETLEVDLDIFEGLLLSVPEAWRDAPSVFLANGDPRDQLRILESVRGVRCAVADTMNHWLREAREALERLARRVTGLILNDEEAVEWTGASSIPAAARSLLGLGPRFVIVKRGEHGSLIACAEGLAPVPAYPVEDVRDPTGAGDTFAGALLACLGPTANPSLADLRRAALTGSVAASFCVEAFGTERLQGLTREACDARRRALVKLSALDPGSWNAAP